MIYTVTLNPSLDYVVRVSDFIPGNLHRTEKEELYVGGKGINVSVLLKELGIESRILGFTAGFTGIQIKDRLKDMGLSHDFVTAGRGMSRINIKLKTHNTVETEINGQGPMIDQADIELLYRKLNTIREGDILTLSGSVPGQLPGKEDTYAHICGLVKERGVKLVIDAEGKLLWNALACKPFLVKPNRQELERLFDRDLRTEESIIEYAMRLQKEGARNVLVSLGEEGALLIDADRRIMRQKAPAGDVLNSVGAGDAMLAGFLAALLRCGDGHLKDGYDRKDYEYSLKYSVAVGSAAAFTAGFPDRETIEKVFRSL